MSLTAAITVTVILLVIWIFGPIVANIRTPENLSAWYLKNIYLGLSPFIGFGLIIVWILYLI